MQAHPCKNKRAAHETRERLETLLDRMAAARLPVFGVGKIEDIFTGRGVSAAVHTKSDADGVDQTLKAMREVDRGLVFTNLVDFDTLYGHRNDVPGYAANLEALDARIPDIVRALREDDVLMLTGQTPLSVQEFVRRNAETFTGSVRER